MPRILALQSLPVAGNLPTDYYAESACSAEGCICSAISFICE